MTARQIQQIYSLGAKLGIVGNDKNDDLHTLVESLTGKSSISTLDENEYRTVIKELVKRVKISDDAPKKSTKTYSQSPGGMTPGQQKKVWYLMYQLAGCDRQPLTVSLGYRLCGIIKKELNIDTTAKNPFAWLTYQDASILIERLKKYVSSAKRKKDRGG